MQSQEDLGEGGPRRPLDSAQKGLPGCDNGRQLHVTEVAV